MPLIKSASDHAFSENLLKERYAGKPLAQALAIAYDARRRAGGKKRRKSKR